MDVVWDSRHSPEWDRLHAAQTAALQQDFAFGLALQALGTDVLRAQLFDQGKLIGIAQFVVRRLGGLFGVALCSRGPVWADGVDPGQRQLGCKLMARSLPQRRPRVVLFAPPAGAGANPVEVPGMTRVITGEASVVIDTTADESDLRAGLHQKWRNRLAAAERSSLQVHRCGDKYAQYRWLLDREGVQRQARSYRALPAEFVPAWQQAVGGQRSALLTVRADLGREAVAAMMFLVHGASATYHLGWTNDQGRELSAHNLLLWRALPMLARLGVRQLDLGGINTQRGASLARFKLGTGGQLVQHPGTFL